MSSITKKTLLKTLVKEWQASGIEEGNTILLHSNVARIYKLLKSRTIETITAMDILDTFLQAVGGSGTLYLPTFNFDFSNNFNKKEEYNFAYDIAYTSSQMGALTEAARKRFGRCNGHPVYSFTCSRKGRFVDNKEAFSMDSPFYRVLEANGKIAVLDLEENNSMTFYHFLEYFWKVPWRYQKSFVGNYINLDRTSIKKEYTIYVRMEGIITNVNPMGELLWDVGLWKGNRPKKGNGLRTIKAQDFFGKVTSIIRDEQRAEGLLFEREKKSNLKKRGECL